MSRKNLVRAALLAVLAVTALFSALGFTAAQEQTPPQSYLGVGLVPADKGVEVQQVAPDSPAAAAGLQVGDLILQIDGKDVTADSIRDVMSGYAVGDTLALSVERSGETLDLSATLAERPADMDSAPNFQRTERPMLGVRLEDSDKGVTVAEVVAGSPAEVAGFKVGDIITKIGDTEVKTAEEAINVVRALKVGDEVTVTVQRDGADVTLTATLAGSMSIQGSMGNIPMDQMPFFSMIGGNGYLGVEFVTLDETAAKEHNVTQTDGALVQAVTTGSPAETAGLKAGDVITAVNNEPVDAEHTLSDRLVAYEPADVITLTVLRGGETLSLEATLGEPQAGLGGMGSGMGGMFPFFHHGQGGQEFNFQMPAPDQPAVPAGPSA
jgi:S1-C subfamily serine protease